MMQLSHIIRLFEALPDDLPVEWRDDAERECGGRFVRQNSRQHTVRTFRTFLHRYAKNNPSTTAELWQDVIPDYDHRSPCCAITISEDAVTLWFDSMVAG
jgi:hypothetical protein